MKNISTKFVQIATRYTVAVVLLSTTFYAGATNHLVQTANFSFTPGTFDAVVGDTVTWELVGSTSHEPASLTVPATAVGWDNTISTSNTSFQYVLAVAGTYTYHCVIHPSMTGTITVATATGITPLDEERAIKLYPQPFHSNLTIDLAGNTSFKNNVTVEVTDAIGQRRMLMNSSEILSTPLVLNLSELLPGMYFVTLTEGNNKKTYRVLKTS